MRIDMFTDSCAHGITKGAEDKGGREKMPPGNWMLINEMYVGYLGFVFKGQP